MTRWIIVVVVAVGAGFGLSVAAGGGGTARADLTLPCGITSSCPPATTTSPPLLPCGALYPCPPTTTALNPTTPTTTPTKPTPVPKPVLAYGGAEYDGHSGTNEYSSLLVERTGSSVSSVIFVFKRGRCSDGGVYANGISLNLKGAKIDSHGVLAYQRTSNGTATTKLGLKVPGQERMTISARFAGSRATGTFTDRFSSKKLNCASEALHFTAYLDGTPGAPVHNLAATTGKYVGLASDHRATGKRKPGQQSFQLQVFLPWGVVTQTKFQWHLVCGKRLLGEESTFGFMPIVGGSRFSMTGTGVDSLAGGVRGPWKYTLHGRFTRTGPRTGLGTYTVAGRFAYKVEYFQGKHKLSTCSQTVELAGKGPKS